MEVKVPVFQMRTGPQRHKTWKLVLTFLSTGWSFEQNKNVSLIVLMCLVAAEGLSVFVVRGYWREMDRIMICNE